MAGVAVDLHIHSCLSPCGDELMTPNNIVRMSALKGLELIAVTDHNTARQLPAVEKVCRTVGMGLLPGLELTTREEAHLLAYFLTVADALAFSEYIYPHLPKLKNKPDFFGEQWVLDDQDERVGGEELLLINALDLSIDQLTQQIRAFHGLPVPAHINRGGNGLLNALGFLPPNLQFAALEVTRGIACPHTPDIAAYRHLHASDAHQLDAIAEREYFLPLAEPSAAAFFQYLTNQ
ncbi:MAG: PHP domain-containing protein [Clostridia bacterium]